MGLPLALLAFGPQGFGAAVALFSISNVIHFSLGSRITSAHARTRDLLLSPLMIATALGFASAASGVRPPDMLFTGLRIMGEAMLPLMLFALGVRLTALRRQDVPRGLLGAFARPALGLALALPLAWALGLDLASKGQLILFGSLPPAVMQFLLAERYRQEPEKVAAMILLGNALAVLFVPLALAWRCSVSRRAAAAARPGSAPPGPPPPRPAPAPTARPSGGRPRRTRQRLRAGASLRGAIAPVPWRLPA
jgi:predicted permease